MEEKDTLMRFNLALKHCYFPVQVSERLSGEDGACDFSNKKQLNISKRYPLCQDFYNNVRNEIGASSNHSVVVVSSSVTRSSVTFPDKKFHPLKGLVSCLKKRQEAVALTDANGDNSFKVYAFTIDDLSLGLLQRQGTDVSESIGKENEDNQLIMVLIHNETEAGVAESELRSPTEEEDEIVVNAEPNQSENQYNNYTEFIDELFNSRKQSVACESDPKSPLPTLADDTQKLEDALKTKDALIQRLQNDKSKLEQLLKKKDELERESTILVNLELERMSTEMRNAQTKAETLQNENRALQSKIDYSTPSEARIKICQLQENARHMDRCIILGDEMNKKLEEENQILKSERESLNSILVEKGAQIIQLQRQLQAQKEELVKTARIHELPLPDSDIPVDSISDCRVIYDELSGGACSVQLHESGKDGEIGQPQINVGRNPTNSKHDMIGKHVMITADPFKGRVGTVKDLDEDYVYVVSKCGNKTIKVDCRNLQVYEEPEQVSGMGEFPLFIEEENKRSSSTPLNQPKKMKKSNQ